MSIFSVKKRSRREESESVAIAIASMNLYKYRLKDKKGNPGGLIVLPNDISPIIIGDLHGSVENFKKILQHDKNYHNLENNNYTLIILGDAFHNDQSGHMLEMNSSMKMLEMLIHIFNLYPENIIYIRGNHDTFNERLVKCSIPQGLEFKKFLLKKKGRKYVRMINEFFENLPYFVIGNKFVITHGGPLRSGATRDDLININYHEDKKLQLMWNRINEFGGNPNNKEYGKSDIDLTLKKLKLPKSTQFIVGHNPLWHTGGEQNGIWINALGIKNYHIIYSGTGSRAPYIKINKGTLSVKFAIPKPKELFYV